MTPLLTPPPTPRMRRAELTRLTRSSPRCQRRQHNRASFKSCAWCKVFLAVLASSLLVACSTVHTTANGVVDVAREQTMLVSAAEVNRSANSAYQDILREAKKKKQLNQNPLVLARVQAIVARLKPATAVFRPDAPGWAWELNVLSSKELNAWCMPGGKMAVFTGLLEQIAPSDDELAAVLGHEIAHALREHGREKAGQSVGLGFVASLGGLLLGV
ncbi:MAG: M48 family metallopeptidase, partial [Pseudomonadota bacterium]